MKLKANNIKDWFYNYKYYALDFASYNMIRLLGFIKYGSFQLSDFLRLSIKSNFTINWNSMVNNSNFVTSKFKTNYGSTILPYIKDFVLYINSTVNVNSFMGLSEYGLRTLNASNDSVTYEFIDGLVGFKNALYVNNDLEDLHIDYIDLTNQNWQQVLGVNSGTLNTNFSKDILYNDGFPWIILPENTSNTYSSYWSWNTANLVPAVTASNINYFAVRPNYHNNSVDQANLTAYNFAAGDIPGYYRFQFVSDEITS